MIFRNVRTFTGEVMTTELVIKADLPPQALEACFALIKSLEATMSAYERGSEVVKINRMAGKRGVVCSPDLLRVLDTALDIARKSGGAFDPTIGALSHFAYGFGFAHEGVPDTGRIAAAAAQVDYTKVRREGDTVMLEQSGMALDLGGIAKGYIAEAAAVFLRAAGGKKVLVSIGGEICCYGRGWRIGIRHPEGSVAAELRSAKGRTVISTSGSYERYIAQEGNHHILDPKTGQSRSTLGGVTLISRSCSLAELDAINTAIFGNEEAKKRLQESFDFELLCIEKEKGVQLSAGLNALAEKVRLF